MKIAHLASVKYRIFVCQLRHEYFHNLLLQEMILKSLDAFHKLLMDHSHSPAACFLNFLILVAVRLTFYNRGQVILSFWPKSPRNDFLKIDFPPRLCCHHVKVARSYFKGYCILSHKLVFRILRLRVQAFDTIQKF